MTKKGCVVLLSGGLDSATLLAWALQAQRMPAPRVGALSVHYGQRHSRELEQARRLCDHYKIAHEVLTLPSNIFGTSALTRDPQEDYSVPVPEGHYADESMKQTVVGNRNMVLISLGITRAIACGFDMVAYAAHAGDHAIYPDCRPTFIDQMRNAAAVCHYEPIQLATPFKELTKGDIVTMGLAWEVPYELTWTCYKGGRKACGKCGSCTERLEAFAVNRAVDPLEYE